MSDEEGSDTLESAPKSGPKQPKSEKKFEDFWRDLEEKTQLTVPDDLRPILEKLGCANELALLNMDKESIEQLQDFARKHLSEKISGDEKSKVFGLFSDDAANFVFVPGHRLLLMAIGDRIREAKATLKRPAQKRPEEARPSKRPRQTSDSTDPLEDDLQKEESILRSLLTDGLERECSVRTDPGKAPLFTVSLDSLKEGTILCHFGSCRKTLKVTRSNLRPWSNQNFYRHVRTLHSAKEADTRQRSLTTMGVTTSNSGGEKSTTGSEENTSSTEQVDEETTLGANSAGDSKWRKLANSKAVRAKRQLEAAAVGSYKLTDFWPLITKMESVIRENESLHTTVRMLTTRIAEHDPASVVLQLPGISPFLQALILSAIRNAHRNQGGERFERELALIAAHFFMVAGRRAYIDLHLNLPKIIPSTSSVLRTIDKSKFVPQPGEFAFEKLHEFLVVRKLPLVINVGIDGTRCVARIQYDPATNQLIGFVPKLVDGVPVLAPFPATSELVIRQYFESETPGSIMQCIVARPLVRNGPTFCLCSYPTDNKFLASDVCKLYEYIEREAAKYGIRIAAHGSDGDTRFLAAMRQRMFPPCDNTLAWRLWFRSSLDIKVPCVQDPTHVGTKLRNLLLRGYEIHMGNFLVSPSHLMFLLQEVSKDQHELTATDIDPKDRMNYRSVEKICDQKVIRLLKEKVADSEATCVYLEMTRTVVAAFLDRSLVPSERLFLIWKATFFFRGWRQWVKNEPTLNLKTSFLTSNTYTCVEINAHALVLLIVYHRDHAGEEDLGELVTWHFGSQDNEDLFRALRSMTGTFSTVINFTPLEFNHRVSRAGLEKDIQQELGHKFKFASSRRIAKRLDEFIPEQGALPSNSEILDIVKNAKQEAKLVLSKLGMDVEIPDIFSIFAEVEIESDDEDDDPPEPQNAQSPEAVPEVPDEEELDFREDNAMASMFSGEVQLRTYDKEVSPDGTGTFVFVKNFYGNPAVVRKSSLVWMLSRRSTVSNDRSSRYHVPTAAPQTSNRLLTPTWKPPIREEYLYLGDWAYFEDNQSIFVGRVLHFQYLSGKRRKYTLRSAPTEPPPGVRPRGIGILGNWYEVQRGVEDMSNAGKLSRIVRSSVSMCNYKFTISRPRVIGNELQLDLHTVAKLDI